MLTGFIFPAFVSDYKGDETKVLHQFSDDFGRLLIIAGDHTGAPLTSFDIKTNNFSDDQLKSQWMSYVFGCAVGDMLKKNRIMPDYLSGYSMGIYSALYCSESVTFTTGIDLITKAYSVIQETVKNMNTGMGSVVGLDKNDILSLIAGYPGVTIANTNSEYSFLLSGIRDEISGVLVKARLEGALHVSLMNVSFPYHSPLLNEASVKFRSFIEREVLVKDAIFNIVSGLDQGIFTARNQIIDELAANLNQQIDWMKTMEKMIGLNVACFVECGAGTSLHKTGKFITGDFRIYTLGEIGEMLW